MKVLQLMRNRAFACATVGVVVLVMLYACSFFISAPAANASGISLAKPHQNGTFIHLAQGARPLAVDPPTCLKGSCDDTDPYQTLCAGQNWDSWWVVTSNPIFYHHQYMGDVQLWYSATCGTDWGGVEPAVPYVHPAVNLLLNDHTSAFYGTTTHYIAGTVGEQLYAPGMLAATESCFRSLGHKVLGTTGQFPIPDPDCYSVLPR